MCPQSMQGQAHAQDRHTAVVCALVCAVVCAQSEHEAGLAKAVQTVVYCQVFGKDRDRLSLIIWQNAS